MPTATKPRVQTRYDANAERENEIESYVHCGKCIAEWKANFEGVLSPKDYARTQTGITADGSLQVWCNRHECNVAVISFTVKP